MEKEVLFCARHESDKQAYLDRQRSWGERNKHKQKRYNRVLRYSGDRSERERFYHRKEWKVLRLQALERDNHRCQYCKLVGRVSIATIGDRVVPAQVSPDKMRNLDNVASCCAKCHDIKTKWEQKYYGTGYDKEGNEKGLKYVEEIADLKKLAFFVLILAPRPMCYGRQLAQWATALKKLNFPEFLTLNLLKLNDKVF